MAFRPDVRLSPERLADEIASLHGQAAVYLPEVEAIVDHVVTGARAGDVVVIMSNGGFGGIHEKLLEALREGEGFAAGGNGWGEGMTIA